MPRWTRREFVRNATLLTAAAGWSRPVLAAQVGSATPPPPLAPEADRLRWMGGTPPSLHSGVTWGRAWPRGTHGPKTLFRLFDDAGRAVPVQSWPLAYWPDGSLKWTAHAIGVGEPIAAHYRLEAGPSPEPQAAVQAEFKGDALVIRNGLLTVGLNRTAPGMGFSVERGGRRIAEGLELVCRVASGPGRAEREEEFQGTLTELSLEQSGPVRAVVRVAGVHSSPGRSLIPFSLRLYVSAGSDCIRIVNTIIYNADPARDYVSALGLRIRVPLRGALHDRHVRFASDQGGLFGEAVRGITGLRRDPGAAVKAAQFEGRGTPGLETWAPTVATRLDYIPAFDDWTLAQLSPDGFEIRKRTQAECSWVSAARGQRAGGLAYIGTPEGGVAAGLKDFWQSYPTQIDIRGARSERAELTVWTWAPEAMPMDLRPYHDGLGQDTHEKQYNGGLEITYEDYEPGFNSPEGVARTSEFHLWCCAATPSRETLAIYQTLAARPPLLISSPEYLHGCGVFGNLWSPVASGSPRSAAIEERLAAHFDFYLQQREERRWYGFWNYGDVMHTYDADRHEWRYDVGGFAWDNSELSTDIWLWLYYLKTGREEVFRFAEAMTRHTGEVDVHHIGRFAPLGSRHNVQHWGCSAKQLRIATAINRRYYYYLTGDERVGDLMREQVEAGSALKRIPPGRKLSAAATKGDLDRGKPSNEDSIGLSIGTDWGSLAGAWLTEWERTGSAAMRDRLVAGMRTIGAQPRGFFTQGLVMNLKTGAFDISQVQEPGVSHLNAVFGLVEVCAELIELLEVPEFRRAWLEYCELYNAPAEQQKARLGAALRGNGLQQGHSRLTAYAARQTGNPALTSRAWKEFSGGAGGQKSDAALNPVLIDGPRVLRPVHEAPEISTNGTAQWGLAAIQTLALLGNLE